MAESLVFFEWFRYPIMPSIHLSTRPIQTRLINFFLLIPFILLDQWNPATLTLYSPPFPPHKCSQSQLSTLLPTHP